MWIQRTSPVFSSPGGAATVGRVLRRAGRSSQFRATSNSNGSSASLRSERQNRPEEHHSETSARYVTVRSERFKEEIEVLYGLSLMIIHTTRADKDSVRTRIGPPVEARHAVPLHYRMYNPHEETVLDKYRVSLFPLGHFKKKAV